MYYNCKNRTFYVDPHPPIQGGRHVEKKKRKKRKLTQTASCNDVTTSISGVGQPKSHKMALRCRLLTSPILSHFILRIREASLDSRRWNLYIFSNLTRFFQLNASGHRCPEWSKHCVKMEWVASKGHIGFIDPNVKMPLITASDRNIRKWRWYQVNNARCRKHQQ